MLSKRQLKRKRRIEKRTRPKLWCRVYQLRDPISDAVIYVGQTRLELAERLSYHLKQALNVNKRSPITRRIKQCLPAIPSIELIDGNAVWDVTEVVWIDRLRREGHPLLNVASVVA